jgi:hypothetical protein
MRLAEFDKRFLPPFPRPHGFPTPCIRRRSCRWFTFLRVRGGRRCARS